MNQTPDQGILGITEHTGRPFPPHYVPSHGDFYNACTVILQIPILPGPIESTPRPAGLASAEYMVHATTANIFGGIKNHATRKLPPDFYTKEVCTAVISPSFWTFRFGKRAPKASLPRFRVGSRLEKCRVGR